MYDYASGFSMTLFAAWTFAWKRISYIDCTANPQILNMILAKVK